MQSMLLGMFDWIGDFFKAMFDLIPKIMYLLYASLACIIDVLQLFFRKLAGLDVFYVVQEGRTVKVAGDLVTSFITGILGINENGFQYSALSTVFWSMVLFGVIICFISVFIAIIKSHYSYNEESAKGPMPIVYTGIKALVNIAAVPIIVVLGLYLSQAILTALDSMTSITSGNILEMYGKEAVDRFLVETDTARGSADNANILGLDGEKTYIYYDIFGYQSDIFYGQEYIPDISLSGFKKAQLATIASTQQSFSGSIFKVAAYNANRARKGEMDPTVETPAYTGSSHSDMALFARAEQVADGKTLLADMIDTAFACNLHLQKWHVVNYLYGGAWASRKYFTQYLALGIKSFSKFNIGLVWYYYDLWEFNFMVGFGAIVVCTTIFINIILGLITRLFMCIGLFLVAPPLFGLTPLDKGEAAKKWRENFMKQVLMAYGAVVGMNIFLLILPYMNEIKFFNIGIADYLAQTLVIIVGLITIKAFISTVSGLIGAEDANKAGDSIKGEVGQTLGKAAALTGGAAKLGGKAIDKLTGGKLSKGMKAVKNKVTSGLQKLALGKKGRAALKEKEEAEKQGQEMEDFKKKDDFLRSVAGKGLSDEEIEDMATEAGFDAKTTKNLVNASKAGGLADARKELAKNDTAFDAGNKAGWANRTKLNREMKDNKTKIEQATRKLNIVKTRNGQSKFRRALASNVAGLGRLAMSGLGQVGEVFGVKDDKSFVGAFAKASGLKKDPNYAKMQYEEMQKMNEGMGGMREDMSSGFGGMHDDMTGMRGDINRGMSGVQGEVSGMRGEVNEKLDTSNATLAEIKKDTDETRRKTRLINDHARALDKKADTLIAENVAAHQELEKTRRKVEAINRKIPRRKK